MRTALQHRTTRLREESFSRDPEAAKVRAEGYGAEPDAVNPYPGGSWQWHCWQKGHDEMLRWQS